MCLCRVTYELSFVISSIHTGASIRPPATIVMLWNVAGGPTGHPHYEVKIGAN